MFPKHNHPTRKHNPPFKHTLALYRGELLEGQLEAASVVGDALGGDAVHGVFQDLLVPDVGLHEVLEARRLGGLVVELEGRGKEG